MSLHAAPARPSRWFLFLLLVSPLLVFGCSDDDGGTTPPPPEPTILSGFVVKGPVEGADVTIHAIAADGSPGAVLDGPVSTDADGAWSLVLPADASADFLVVAKGGSYVDEADPGGFAIEIGDREMVGYGHRSRPDNIVVSPLTQVLADLARDYRGEGMNSGDAWQKLSEAMEVSLGFDVTTTRPMVEGSATPEQKLYASILGGFSLLTDRHFLLDDIDAHPVDLILGLARDLTDGAWDGRDWSSNPIRVPLQEGGTSELPPLDGGGFEPLFDFARQYRDSEPDLHDVVIPEGVAFDPPPPEVEFSCEDLPSAAYRALEVEMFALQNGPDPDRPDDVELDDAHFLYGRLLECDDSAPTPRFALALLDLAALASDERVNAAFDEWDAYLEEFVPFATDAPEPTLSVMPGIPDGANALRPPLALVQRMMLAPMLSYRVRTVPQVSEAQDIFTDVVLPVVDSSIEHMDRVLQHPDFTFRLSGRVQGDALEEDKVADRTDFLALRAALHGLRAGLQVAVAYEVSLPAYTGQALLDAMEPGSGTYLTLRAGGEAAMRSVPASLLAAANDVDAAITSLLGETGDQSDDVLKIGPNTFYRQDLESFQATELPMIQASLEGPVTHVYDWDFQPSTPDVALRVDIGAFFENPVEDWKAVAPAYVLSMETVPFDTDYGYSYDTVEFMVDAPSDGYAWAQAGVSWIDFERNEPWLQGDSWLASALLAELETHFSEIEGIPGWVGEGNISLYAGRTMSIGEQTISASLDRSWETAEDWVEIPVITFDADTFTEWMADFSDPTMRGLFPDAVSGADVIPLFGMRAEDWRKVVKVDWPQTADDGGGPIGPGF